MFVVDLGFSSAKWLCESNKGLIKSCYRKTKEDDAYLFRGERYLVGEKALLQTGSHYLRTVEELIEFYPLFVYACAEKAGIEGRDDVLVVGSPYDFWKDETAKARKGTASLITSLTDSLRLIQVNGSSCEFSEVFVFPQGLGGIKDYLSENECKTSNILAIDIGFNTVISTLYSCDENAIIHGRTYYKKGLHDMAVNLLMPDIQKHIQGKTLTPIELNHVIQAGYIQLGFEKIDLKPEIENAIDTYVNDLLTLILGDMKAHGGVIAFDTVLVFGGGARYLHGKVESTKVNIVVLPEPEFANVRGFQIKAKEVIS